MITLFYSNKSFIKLEKDILYINIEFLNNIELITLLEYLKNIFLLTKENHNKYFLQINLININVLNKKYINIILSILNELKDILISHLNSTCLIIKSDYLLTIIKPILNKYDNCRPFKICENEQETKQFFKLNKLN